MRTGRVLLQPLAFNIHNAERFEPNATSTSPAGAGIYSAVASRRRTARKGGFEEEGH